MKLYNGSVNASVEQAKLVVMINLTPEGDKSSSNTTTLLHEIKMVVNTLTWYHPALN